MHTQRLTMTLLVMALGVGGAKAGEFTFSWHEFSGSGCANVFDGGPPVCDSESLSGPDYAAMGFSAVDMTEPGTLGASARAYGESRIGPYDEDGMRIMVELDTEYAPSFFPGGDNPGGAAEGELLSIIEFVMPVDELLWSYGFDIDDTISFEGATTIVFENVTQSEILLALSDEDTGAFFDGILSGNTGDLMRITSQMSGGGSTGPGSVREYEAVLGMIFTIPEPATLCLLGLMVLAAPRRRARIPAPHR